MNAETANMLPLLPLRDMVLMVHMEYPVVVGRPHSIAAVEAALASEDKSLVVVAQRDSTADELDIDKLYRVGTRAVIRRMERPNPNTLAISLRGLERVEIDEIDRSQPFLQVRFKIIPLPVDTGDEVEALHRDILELAQQIDELMAGNWPRGLLPQMLQSLDDPLDHVYVLASLLKLDVEQQQALHEAETRLEALRLAHGYLTHEVQVLTIQQEIAKQAASNVSKEQRHYMLRKQMAAIQKELGEENPEQAELEALRQRMDEAQLPEHVRKVVDREMERLSRMPAAAHDYQLVRSYLELIAELPWAKSTEEKLDLQKAREILDADHYDLEAVKERIIEHLAVRKLNPQSRGAILCFVGGPGVGKTSLGESIARSLNRKFERISLGGLHDEAELRGHRRTYIGAMPGRIIQALRRTGVNNPVILLDELDKLGRDYRGDPSAALMEILDPAQNTSFRDNYLDLPFDLSNVFFVATANTLETIPRPLLDRMEVLRLSGYTEEEKIQIARRYLVPRQLDDVKLSEEQISFSQEALEQIIRRYTREAGVRELNRQLARAVRKVAVRFAEGDTTPVRIEEEQLAELLGPERFHMEERRKEHVPGVATGLAWTEAGGDVLYVESVLMPGGKGLMLTGQLGEVMKESAQTAKSYLWSQADSLGIDLERFKESGIHVHVPAGAIPKDGPSAGVTIATSMLSLLKGKAARGDTAMTGEITLAGLVLPVGGIKEKVLAARRAGMARVILPKDNSSDLKELDNAVQQGMEFILASNLKDVFAAAFPTGTVE